MYFTSCTNTNALNAYIQPAKPGDHYFISKSKYTRKYYRMYLKFSNQIACRFKKIEII